jgi:hypothetical protein
VKIKMKFNFKKIAPIFAGAILLGSTIGFAGTVAATAYPADFGGSVVVIGAAGTADAAAADLIANDVAALTTGVSASVSSGWLASKSGEDLNYGESISSIDSSIGDEDLSVLADGTYKETKGDTDNDVDYEQTLDFVANGEKVVFAKDDTQDNEPTATYLKLLKGTNAYTYTLEFTDDVKYTNDTKEDFELSKLKILGTEWTITDATTVASAIDKLTMMGGAATSTLKSGSKASMVVGGVSYSVEAIVFTDKAEFTINGETLTIDAGSTDELADGTVIGVTEVSTSAKEATPDTVTFYLGARKLVLEDGEAVELNGEDIDGSLVDITSTANKLAAISISYAPDEDDVFIGVGKSWTDPVFGAIKLVFASIDKTTEKIEVTTTADDGKLKVTDIAGNDLEIPFVDNDTGVFIGDDSVDNAVVADGTQISGNLVNEGATCTGITDIEDCEGLMFIAVDSGGEARIIEVKNFDVSNGQIDFYDETKGSDIKDVDYVNGTQVLDLNFIDANVTINETQKKITFNDINKYTGSGSVAGGFQTELEGGILIDQVGQAVLVKIYQENGSAIAQFNMTIDSDGDMVVKNIDATMLDVTEGSDTQVGLDVTNWGAILTWDSEDMNDLTIEYPEEKVVANVYVSPVSAVVSGGGVATVVKDSDVDLATTASNLIVVGGSAVNNIAAKLVKVTYPTYGDAWASATGVGADMAIIKLFSGATDGLPTGKVALLVAGYETKDTLAAAKYLIANKAIDKKLNTAVATSVTATAL